MVAKWTLFWDGPPSKPPGPTLDHGLVSPIGWGFSDLRNVGEKWSRRREKRSFFEDSRFKLFKRCKISLNWGKQSEQILFEKLNVFDVDEQVQKECSG